MGNGFIRFRILGRLWPPQSPKGDGPDLSQKAWARRIYSDLSIGIQTDETGFNNFETWRSHTISEHAKRVVPDSTSLEKSGIRKRQRRPTLVPSERSRLDAVYEILTSLINFSSLTRSKTSTTSLFYELGSNNKTSQLLSPNHLFVLQKAASHVNQELPRSRANDYQSTSVDRNEDNIRMVSLLFFAAMDCRSRLPKRPWQVDAVAICPSRRIWFGSTPGGHEEPGFNLRTIFEHRG